MYLNSRLGIAEKALERYLREHRNLPLSRFLSIWFQENKKMGSRDRRMLSHILYSFFRLGKAFSNVSIKDRLLHAKELFQIAENEEIEKGNQSVKLPENSEIFPFKDLLSAFVEEDFDVFAKSFLEQPMVWIRIRKGYESKVLNEAESFNIRPIWHNSNKAAFGQRDKLTSLKSFENGWFEIQDISSQESMEYLGEVGERSVWECCSGAGGKSLIVSETSSAYHLCTDIRPSVLNNLRERFLKKQFSLPDTRIADASVFDPGRNFDLIIADVPCSGSGTWARTPENLYFFEKEDLQKFVNLQKNIIANIIDFLKPGGELIYLTCSVFREENEAQVEYLQERGLELIEMHLFKGYLRKSDAIFFAKLKKKN